MDAPSSNSINPAVPRQRSSPANEHSLAQSPMPQQQPYPYPVQQQQQQQAGWQPPQQYYPQFYQNPHQQPYPMHGHPGHPQQGQMPYYDPANAQFAQWAYQQMLLNQAHQMSQMSQAGSQRSRSGGNSSSDYFGGSPMAGFSPFPSGTPPAHPSQLPMGYASGPPSEQGSQYGGYHPYRRPQRHGSQNQDSDWRNAPSQHSGPFKPPYAHADAAGSSTSVNSGSSQSGSQRQRTNSTQGSGPGASNASSAHPHAKSSSSNGHSSRSATSSSTPPAPSNTAPRMHQRTGSSSSTASSRPPAPSATPTSSSAAPHSAVNLRKPSPLSQGTFTAAEKRMSRDDSDLAAMLEPTSGVRSAGLKGRLRRALSLNANNALREEEEDDATARIHPSRPSQSSVGSSATLAMDDGDSTATVQKKKSRSLFNSKLNRSTDNISLSSTMSSASMVIRKLGNIGKLARRNSLAGITSLFKDKKDKEGEEEGGSGKKSKKKKGEKATAADPSVSHATAEPDRSDWSSSPEMAGLSPAARLARQHTLKSNAEAAARAKAEAEARAAAAAAAAASQGPVPTTWEKNTTTRQGDASPGKPGSSSRVAENGTRVVVEHDDSDSEDGHSDLGHGNHSQNYSIEGWEDDEDWNEAPEDEDVTIRQALDNASLEDDEEMEPWAINVRRSIERTLKPAKGILKTRPDGSDYKQDAYLPPNPSFTRMRSNSYDSAPPSAELPPLGHLPPSDPAQIDGLHKQHGSSSNGHSPQNSSFLPPLSFDSNGLAIESPKHEEPATSSGPSADKSALFNHPNSSAPALSLHSPNPPTLTHRSQTAPTKRLAFAANLSVYDTFPATVYDRRSEPATWSRLTPALAQRIKEELNSYKMEEMEVHAASRVHTQFFV
ncbi:hypothetical protein BV20DRAFT_1052798 [Pilatotrama ljubarskyi]|nr:hypothetical protein BV20DRAFT_1052798 [Pilatotrama ljubarskyi]